MATPLRIGLSASMFHPDPTRVAYNGRRLLYYEESMGHFIYRHGALPVLLPTSPVLSEAAYGLSQGAKPLNIDDMVASLDAVVMTGGVDVAPESYGEKPLRPEWSGDAFRDAYELALIKAALKHNKPLFGICRGHQILNVALGGTLFQDILTQNPEAIVHRDADTYEKNEHGVVFESGSGWSRLLGIQEGRINSVHHQAVKDLAPELRVEARSLEDGIVESFRLKDGGAGGVYLVGVQWHPEFQPIQDTRLVPGTPIFEEFLNAARERRR